MKLIQVTTKGVVAVSPRRTLRQAASLMDEEGVGSLLVQEGERVVGLITERDVLRALATGADPDEALVEEYMTTDPVFGDPEMEVEEAAMIMAEGGFRHLPVASGGEVVGMVSVRDLLPLLSWREKREKGGEG